MAGRPREAWRGCGGSHRWSFPCDVVAKLKSYMCIHCLVEERPCRETCALDDGHFIVNLKSCASCGQRSFPVSLHRSETSTEEDEEETIEVTYEHACECGHLIAMHYFREVAGSECIRYLMDCILCGKGSSDKVPHAVRMNAPAQMSGNIDSARAARDDSRSTALISSLTNQMERIAASRSVCLREVEQDDEWAEDDAPP